MAQLGVTQLQGEASVGSLGELAIGEQSQALLEAKRAGFGQRTLLGELAGHGGQFELLQLVDGGMT